MIEKSRSFIHSIKSFEPQLHIFTLGSGDTKEQHDPCQGNLPSRGRDGLLTRKSNAARQVLWESQGVEHWEGWLAQGSLFGETTQKKAEEEFPIAATTNCHKIGELKQHTITQHDDYC